MWRLIGALALVSAVAGGLWKAYDLGAQGERARAAVVLAEWKASIQQQELARRDAQREALASLQGELDELRSRPEQVRIVTRTVRLKPDAECGSLSPDFKRLWDAGYESGLRMGAATAAAGMDDASRVALADAQRVIEEAKYRFEFNAVRLTACQAYIRTIRKEPEK